MKTLYKFLLLEGGASGHMAHPIDYEDFTMSDLIELVTDLFSGRIEDITEKVDGTNIQATMNKAGEVVFIRNKTDLNSERGGMSVSDMAAKWADKPSVANTFVTAGQIIEKVFNKVGKDWFNPDDETRRVLNCECVVAGVTNIMPYANAQVDFHDIWIYKKLDGEWVKDKVTKQGINIIDRACEDIYSAHITPQLIISMTKDSNKVADKYINEIRKLFNNRDISIDEWKFNRFHDYLYDRPELSWVLNNRRGIVALYHRWFNANKSTNIKAIKNYYPGHELEIANLDKKAYKEIVSAIIEPLDILFLSLGNEVISLCQGIINQGQKDSVIQHLIKDMEEVQSDVEASDNEELKIKLNKQLNRLSSLGNKINPVEGIVFNYKGRLMKLTGSFAPLNSILGTLKFGR